MEENSGLVYQVASNVLTNSVLVANKFGKEHQHVLRDIRNLMESMSNFGETPLFEEQTYIHPQNGQTYPMFIMNRDGFTLLAMGFTGEKALKFKLDYINAFNKMESSLKKPSVPLTPAQQLLANAQLLVEMEQRQSQIEAEQKLLNSRQSETENKITLIEERIRDNGYMTVMGFANIQHLKIGTKTLQKLGKQCAAWCRRMGIIPEQTKHDKWGHVNTYPMQALRAVFKAAYPDKAALIDVPTYWG